MNDPNKRIDVNLSSLLSLKAELLRKQAEVNKAKSTHLINNSIPKKRADKPAKTKQKIPKEPKHIEEHEDTELLKKSRRILEAKTKLYNKMSANGGGGINSDDTCLVMFNHKKQSETSNATQQSSYYNDESSSSDDDHLQTDDNTTNTGEWVEYTDCLGRTRKCLKEDLEFFKKKDIDLADTVSKRQENVTSSAWFEDTKGSIPPPSINPVQPPVPVVSVQQKNFNDDDSSTIASKIDEMRSNWDKQEEENINKDFVHYQDILFDEARTHGVGYYGFSTDDAERAKQRKELDDIRNKTLAAQKQREEQKKRRENIIAERVKAAKNRQRARLGLPPLEDKPEITEKDLYDKSIEEKRIAAKEKERATKELEEKLLAEERKQHLRPWDKGKSKSNKNDDNVDDDNWVYKPEREPMSQEQWNEKKRSERNAEFAPLNLDSQTAVSHSYNRKQFEKKRTEPVNENRKKTLRRRLVKNDDDDEDDGPPGVDSSEYKPIRNELSDNSSDEDSEDDDDVDENRKGCNIPPPPTFDYYGPTSTKHRKLNQSAPPNIENSIAAGLKFLREQSDKGILGTKQKWSSNVNY